MHDLVYLSHVDARITVYTEIPKTPHLFIKLCFCKRKYAMLRKLVHRLAKAPRNSPLFIGDQMVGKIQTALNRNLKIEHDNILRIGVP